MPARAHRPAPAGCGQRQLTAPPTAVNCRKLTAYSSLHRPGRPGGPGSEIIGTLGAQRAWLPVRGTSGYYCRAANAAINRQKRTKQAQNGPLRCAAARLGAAMVSATASRSPRATVDTAVMIPARRQSLTAQCKLRQPKSVAKSCWAMGAAPRARTAVARNVLWSLARPTIMGGT